MTEQIHRTGTPSPELVEQLTATALEVIPPAWVYQAPIRKRLAREIVEALIPVIASVDENAHNRGRAELAAELVDNEKLRARLQAALTGAGTDPGYLADVALNALSGATAEPGTTQPKGSTP